MKTECVDLDRTAEVHWRNPSPYRPELGGHRRRFGSLADAVRFVVEDLTDHPQLTARIATDVGYQSLSQIRILYSRLTAKV